MNLTRIYGLFLRHFYLISRSFPRILDLIYWPSIQITLWGFISNFFAANSNYYGGAVGVILSCAILYGGSDCSVRQSETLSGENEMD